MPEGLVAQAAQVEDWDSDENSAVPGTVVQAQQRAGRAHPSHPSRQQQQQPSLSSSSSSSRRTIKPDVASDSGYSSLAARSPAPPRLAIPTPPGAPKQAFRSPARPSSKPIIHRADSARSTQNNKPAPVPAPPSSERQKRKCSDPNCCDPTCGSSRPVEPRYSQNQQLPPPQPPRYPNPPQYQQAPSYPYPQMSPAQAAAMMPPPPVPVPRPRTGSNSRAQRPVSFHGYSSMSYGGIAPGPPPSASAYYALPQQYVQQPPAYLDPMTSASPVGSYPSASPAVQTPSSPSIPYPGFPSYSNPYSARQANPAVPGLEMPHQKQQPGLTRRLSARRPPEERPRRPLPAPVADTESTGSDTGSASEYDSDASSDDEYYRTKRDPRRHKERAVALVHHERRPSMHKKYHTETALPIRSRRESMHRDALRRAPRSDPLFDTPSSSDLGDSDRTARAVIEHRSSYSSAHSSRRPSVSTTASSGRTKATTLSGMTDNSRGQLVVEDKHGRRLAYLSKEAQSRLASRIQHQQLEDVVAYQQDISGGEPYELTAENIRRVNSRKTGSHISGRSQKSGASGSKASRSEGLQIMSGDTVFTVIGDAKVEMRPSEDGGPARFVIASGNGRESEYRTSSKSSGSRVGRPRGRSTMNRVAIREDPDDYEDGYERAR